MPHIIALTISFYASSMTNMMSCECDEGLITLREVASLLLCKAYYSSEWVKTH